MCHQAQDYEQSSIKKYSSLLFPLNAFFIVPVTVTKAPASGKSYGYIIESGGIKFNPDGQHPVKSQLITTKYLFLDFQLNLHFQFPEDFPELYSDQRK